MSKLVSEKKVLGIGPRLLKAADRLAPIAGTANGLIRPFMAKGGGSVNGAVSLIGESIKGFKFRNPISTTMDVLNDTSSYTLMSDIVGILGGLVAEQAGQELGGQVGDFLKTGGGAAMKFGTTSAFMNVITGYFLEQGGGGGGMIAPLAGKVGGLRSGAGLNSRVAMDNPDRIPDAKTSGLVSPMIGTEF